MRVTACAQVLRRYCGRIVERMLRRFRIDDFLVSFARLHATVSVCARASIRARVRARGGDGGWRVYDVMDASFYR